VLADRVGRRFTIVLSMVASAAAMLGFAVAQGVALLLTGAFVVGLFAALGKPATEAFIADVVPAGRKVTAFAIYRLAVNLGTAAGPAVGGLLADRLFASLFVGNALAAIAVALIALSALPAGKVRSRADTPVPQTADRATHPLISDPALMVFLAGALLWSLVYFQQLVGLPLQVRSLRFSYTLYGVLLSLNALLVTLFEVPFARISESRPRHLMVAVGVVLVGLGYGATALAGTPLTLALTVAIWSAGEIVASPVAYAYVTDLAPEDSRGRYQGAWNATFSVGLLGASAGGWLFTAGPGLLWGGCAAACCVAAGLVLISQRVRRERSPRAAR
jgi:MFS family permease